MRNQFHNRPARTVTGADGLEQGPTAWQHAKSRQILLRGGCRPMGVPPPRHPPRGSRRERRLPLAVDYF